MNNPMAFPVLNREEAYDDDLIRALRWARMSNFPQCVCVQNTQDILGYVLSPAQYDELTASQQAASTSPTILHLTQWLAALRAQLAAYGVPDPGEPDPPRWFQEEEAR